MRKSELHLHLRGAIPPRYLVRQLRKYPLARALESAPGPQLEWLLKQPNIRAVIDAGEPASRADDLFRYRSFEQFLAAYLFTSFFVRTIEDFAGLVRGVRRQLRQANIVYAEITVSLREYMQQGLALADLAAVLDAHSAGPPAVRWIVDPVRNFGPQAAERLLEAVLKAGVRSVVGLTLGGAEHTHPHARFGRAYELAREGGLRTTVHAGEALGPESVREALRSLAPDRVGHGVRAAEDPALVRRLAERGIPLEVCPTSNVRTGVYAALADHPVRSLYEAGVPVTISTDDPTFFSVSLARELAGLRELGFSWREIGELAGNGFRYAFDPEAAASAARP